MNYEKLNQIAATPALISQQDARELEELTRNFPYFPTPYVLLSHYYLKNNDYRFEDTLQKTALRVENREWLYNFLYSDTLIPETEIQSGVELLDAETSEPLNEVEFETAFSAPLTDAESETEEITEDIWSHNPAAEADTLLNMQRLFEIDLEPLDGAADEPEQTEQEQVYEEIGEFDGIPVAETLAPEISEQQISDELMFENLGASSILVPFSETEELEEESEQVVSEELSTDEIIEKTESPAIPIAEETMVTEPPPEDQIFEEIPDDFSAISVPLPIMETPTAKEEETLKPAEEEPLKVKPIFAAAVYNIEDYYPPVKEEKDPTDFFSWLSNPKFQEEEKEPEKKIIAETNKKENLIEKFLRTNPGISRPKNDFFSPGDFAKKSEQLPDDLATETLANVYLSQNNPAHAIKIYEKLMLKFPEKSPYFAGLIEKTKKEHNL